MPRRFPDEPVREHHVASPEFTRLLVVAFGVAAAIGLGRMADGWHWASDTMTGTLLGIAVGTAVANRQLSRNPIAAGPRPRITVPIPLLRISF